MTITELIEMLQKYNKEIGCDGKNIASHNIKSFVNFVIDLDSDVQLEPNESEYPNGIEMNMLPSCGCGYGITFHLQYK
jgi:hypothetical protein